MVEINMKLEEYRSLLDFKHEYQGKDLKNNFKFIDKAVKKFKKEGLSSKEILKFLDDTIRIHKSSFGLLINKR